jgi:hypothetical protein
VSDRYCFSISIYSGDAVLATSKENEQYLYMFLNTLEKSLPLRVFAIISGPTSYEAIFGAIMVRKRKTSDFKD